MRVSQTLIPTLKENPVEAHTISHRLMLRAGLIRQIGAGIYTWLPLGLRVLHKVSAIVRAEMDNAGAQEVLMPAVCPAELWRETGRWDFYGKELLRLTDRHDRQFCFGPTHEEVIVDLARREIRSYKELPANFYQIQTKFRDEIRPRFGIMRGREFLMKDAYSFDLDAESLDASYQNMFVTYEKIFKRCGLSFRAVEADTGAIGGAFSHEFHVLAESGEDTIASCDGCGYAANLEKAVSRPLPKPPQRRELAPMLSVPTPGKKSIEEVALFLNLPTSQTVKSLLVQAADQFYLLLLRGDQQLNEIKATAVLGAPIVFPSPEHVLEKLGLPVGFLGPIGINLPILADPVLEGMTNFVCGANAMDTHFTGVHWERDLPLPRWVDLSNVQAGEACSRCKEGHLTLTQGIEVGHIFKLQAKYTQAMGMTILDEKGATRTPLMGCYGIGVSRIVAAAIEQNHDVDGIVWPLAIAPFAVQILLLNPKDVPSVQVAETLYLGLKKLNIETLLDDRDERAGVKFKDADLLGIPWRVVIGDRGVKEGQLEIKSRVSRQVERIPIHDGIAFLQKQITMLNI
ncbi:MAG: proline--tRNA ligase [Magnetococcus sp. DMHC-6]